MRWGRSRKQARLELLNRSDFRKRSRSRIGIGEGDIPPFPLLGALLVLGIVLGVLHNRWNHAGHPDPVLAVPSATLVPAQIGAARVQNAAVFSWDSLFGARRLKEENLRLKAEIDRLTQENESLTVKALEADRLREAIGFRRKSVQTPIAAEVIAWLPFASVDTITVARGTRDGIRPGTIVRTPSSLVGRVTESGLLSSQTLLLTDVSSEVGALVRRGAKMQAIGIVQGTGRGQELNLKHLLPENDVKPGDKVYTSGFGGIVPPDIPIGIISSVTEDKAHFLKTAKVTTLTNLPGDLREVYLVRSNRAEDIFAEPSPAPSPSPAGSLRRP
ncbi:MAG: rod shape-determining protein MreC [Armatimonadota bacterium]